MKYIAVFDIDGVLADYSHRANLPRKSKEDYKKFQELAEFDTPIKENIDLLNSYRFDYITVYLCSCRPESTRKTTEDWLDKHNICYEKLLLRNDNNFDKDSDVKIDLLRRWLDYILIVYDDKPEIIRSFLELGIDAVKIGNRKD